MLIAVREFFYNLRRPSFLFAVFGTPLILAVALMFSGLAGNTGGGSLDTYKPVGFVDRSADQILSRGIQPEDYPDTFVRYASLEEADAAARTGQIKAYIEVGETYFADAGVTLFTMEAAPSDLFDAIDDFLRANLAADVPNTLAVTLLADRPNLDITVQEGNRSFNEEGVIFVTILPVVFGFLLVMSSVTTSTFLMNGLVEEKTNRIMEVLITSVKPMQLLVGKLIGMGALGLLQVITFLTAGFVGLSVAQNNNILQGLTIPPDMAVLALIYYFLSYFLLAAFGIAIGAVVGSEQESRQLSGFIVLPVMIPYILLVSFIIDPNGALPTALSLIPFTAPMAILMRVGLTTVPLWQIAFSITGLILMNLIVLWVSARLFRWGVLSTSKMPNLRRLFQVLRGKTPEIAPSRPKSAEAA